MYMFAHKKHVEGYYHNQLMTLWIVFLRLTNITFSFVNTSVVAHQVTNDVLLEMI